MTLTLANALTVIAIKARREVLAFPPVFRLLPALSCLLACRSDLRQGILQSEVWHAENSSDAVSLVSSLSPNQCPFHAADRLINAGGES